MEHLGSTEGWDVLLDLVGETCYQVKGPSIP